MSPFEVRNMKPPAVACPPLPRLLLCVCVAACGLLPLSSVADLLGGLFKKVEIQREIWREQEQYVGLAAQGEGSFPPNQHPAELDAGEVRDALRSLELWEKGGLLRNEQSVPVFTQGQTETLGRYLAQGLQQAKPEQDVLFVVRGYGGVMLDTLKEREWTSGRAFVANGKLNVILGSFKIRKDRAVRNAEAAYGVLNDYSDMYFDPGSRTKRSKKMPGRVVSTSGVSFAGGDEGSRPDWIVIDVAKAALAYREGLVPEEEKKRETKARQEAAKLTIERRQMREEMARLRQELKQLKGGSATTRSIEDRLSTLDQLKSKALINDDEYQRRRAEILGDI
jgi:hypothetical protein